MSLHRKKTFRIFVVLLFVFLALLALYREKCIQENQAKIDNLISSANKKFLIHDYDSYLEELRSHGLRDLKVKYNYHDYWFEEDGTFFLSCKLTNFTSRSIDRYYTTDFEDYNAQMLALIMRGITEDAYQQFTYTTDDGIPVVVILCMDESSYSITSSQGHSYGYRASTFLNITIDGELMYHDQVPEEYIPWLNQGKCIYSSCENESREGSNYCRKHGCCIPSCANQKDPYDHCCYTHNCIVADCGYHRYEEANSNYCSIHYRKH